MICRSPPPGISPPLSVCPCSVRRMSTPEDNAETVNRYLELASQGRADDIAELYAADGTVEDPVGGEVHIGRQAIRGFYDGHPDQRRLGRRRHAAGPRQRGGVLLGAHHRSRREQDAHRHHQRHDVQRGRQDRVDEGLLDAGEHHPAVADSAWLVAPSATRHAEIAIRRRRTTSRCSGRSRPPPCTRGRTRGGRTYAATGWATSGRRARRRCCRARRRRSAAPAPRRPRRA